MNSTRLDQATEEVVALKLKALDRIIKELVEPIDKIGSPEKVLGKKYEEWTPEDLQRLIIIYGRKEPSPLSDLVFDKKLKEVQALEQEVV